MIFMIIAAIVHDFNAKIFFNMNSYWQCKIIYLQNKIASVCVIFFIF